MDGVEMVSHRDNNPSSTLGSCELFGATSIVSFQFLQNPSHGIIHVTEGSLLIINVDLSLDTNTSTSII